MALTKMKSCLLQQIVDTEDMILCEYARWSCWVCTTLVPGPSHSVLPFWHLGTVLAQVHMWPQCEPVRLGKWTDLKTSVHTAAEITASADCFPTCSHSVLSLSSNLSNLSSRNHLRKCSVEHLICFTSSSPAPLELLLHSSCLFLFIPSPRLP